MPDELGLDHGAVRVVKGSAAWPAAYERIAADLRSRLCGLVDGIEHVGSTAVPGLDAKPIGPGTGSRISMLSGLTIRNSSAISDFVTYCVQIRLRARNMRRSRESSRTVTPTIAGLTPQRRTT